MEGHTLCSHHGAGRQASRGQTLSCNYGNFQTSLYEEIRREAFGEDIGQTSWLTADELDRFLGWLELAPGRTLLDVACGAGGPALRIAAATGCSIVGIDGHEKAVATASAFVAQRGRAERAEFHAADAAQPLPFTDASFDAITCIDAINHLPDRQRVFAEWARLLKPSGRLLFTDPTTVTGALTNAEIGARGSAGYYLFVPQGYNERIMAQCRLRLLISEDVTANMAKVAEARRAARALRSPALREIEGDPEYDRQQEFLAVAGRVAKEGRSDFQHVGQRARRRVAHRLLPFVFLLYVVNYIDRVNISFANLGMSADLGFSDRVYGLGIGMFYVNLSMQPASCWEPLNPAFSPA